MAGNCDICNKRIAQFSHHLCCSYCDKSYHIKCLPLVTNTDSIYVNRNENQWFCIKCASNELPFNNLDEDCDFYDALSEFWFDISRIPVKDLQEKIFVPFELNSDDYHHPLFDVDPSVTFWYI